MSKKHITRWPGIVKEIQTTYIGTILFKGYFEIRFVPVNVQPTMPSEGDKVEFCLGFDRTGLSAWWVKTERSYDPLEAIKPLNVAPFSYKTADENPYEEEEDVVDENVPQTEHFESNPTYENSDWHRFDGKRMLGVVFSTEPSKGYGYLKHPNVSGKLFFHASQLVSPVITLAGAIDVSKVLEFRVELFMGRMRATDIHEVEVRHFNKYLSCLKKFHC